MRGVEWLWCRLEKLQLKAARVVTGLLYYVNRVFVIFRNWVRITCGSTKYEIFIYLMLNIVNNYAPSYQQTSDPHRISETTNYPLRNVKIMQFLYI